MFRKTAGEAGLGQRINPSKAGKASKVRIARRQYAIVLNSQGREVRIGNEIAGRLGGPAHLCEMPFMTGRWMEHAHTGQREPVANLP